MKNKKLTAVFILLTYFFSTLPPAAYTQDVSPDRTPEPYGVDEFNTWQKDLRRFEIISFGALPFVTFLSFWTYDIIRSVQHKGDSAYAPWPIKNPETAVPLSEGEQKKIFFASIGISIGIAIIDFRTVDKTEPGAPEKKSFGRVRNFSHRAYSHRRRGRHLFFKKK